MKKLNPSKLITLCLLGLIVAVLGLVSKTEKRNSEQGRLSKGIIPSALADTPSVPEGGACASESLESAAESAPESCCACESCY